MADGKLLLSFLPREERSYLYEVDGLRKYTKNTIVDPVRLEEEITWIRQHRYAVDHYERFETTRGLAVPVMDLDEQPLMAMLCVGNVPDDADAELELARQMQAAAAEMSAHIAATGDMPKASTEFAKYNLE